MRASPSTSSWLGQSCSFPGFTLLLTGIISPNFPLSTPWDLKGFSVSTLLLVQAGQDISCSPAWCWFSPRLSKESDELSSSGSGIRTISSLFFLSSGLYMEHFVWSNPTKTLGQLARGQVSSGNSGCTADSSILWKEYWGRFVDGTRHILQKSFSTQAKWLRYKWRRSIQIRERARSAVIGSILWFLWLTKLQYIFLCCPEISVWQYHPFTLTSAPEEDYISVHIRCVGDFTTALAAAVGCNFGKDNNERPGLGISAVVGLDQKASALDLDPSLKRILPRVFIDGPFGSASEDVFKYEIAVLVGAGIGVTPFASILKSIWYRMNYPSKRTRLRKVYFFWVCRDFGSFEWFKSLLMAIESQDMDSHIEIHTVCLSHHAVPPSPHSTNEINPPPLSLFSI